MGILLGLLLIGIVGWLVITIIPANILMYLVAGFVVLWILDKL